MRSRTPVALKIALAMAAGVAGRRFAGAEQRLVGTVDQFDNDFRNFWQAQNWIESPIKAGYP